MTRATREPEPKRANRARAVSSIVPEIGASAFRRFGFVQSSVVSRWREIVGQRYAEVSSPESIRFPPGRKAEGVLTLVVEGAYAPMMQHVAPAIVERVNRFFGYQAVARVHFRQGRPAPATVRAAPPSIDAAPANMEASVRAIADPELRACLEALAGAIVARDAGAAAAAPTLSIPVVGKIRSCRNEARFRSRGDGGGVYRLVRRL